jgi:hypothetical protein
MQIRAPRKRNARTRRASLAKTGLRLIEVAIPVAAITGAFPIAIAIMVAPAVAAAAEEERATVATAIPTRAMAMAERPEVHLLHGVLG